MAEDVVREHTMEAMVEESLGIIDAAIAAHKPSHVFAMFSGGHDSLTATAITARHPRFAGAVHINTGIGIEETREFVRATCEKHGWPLLEYGPPEALGQKSYRELVLEFGFPGPAQHPMMFTRLKERGVRALIRDHKEHDRDRILLSTGIRLQESVRRLRNYSSATTDGQHFARDGAKVWTNPIATWSKPDCYDLIEWLKLDRNPVVDLMHLSGECLCGAFAKPDEIREIETWFPKTAEQIHALEREVEAAGQIGCVWGRRPDNVNADQMRLMPILPLCTSCEAGYVG